MSATTSIEWTESTWNPLRALPNPQGKPMRPAPGWACVKVSPGCANCYAERMNIRLGTGADYTADGLRHSTPYLDEDVLRQPLKWKKPRRVFVCSMTDLFGEWVTEAQIDQVFSIMALCPQHTFQVLTKRAERMAGYFSDARQAERVWDAQGRLGAHPDARETGEGPLLNVWLGVSVEDQARADERIPHLLRCPAAVRWLSIEPMLGPVELRPWRSRYKNDGEPRLGSRTGIDWVVLGGESGPGARPMHPDWARGVRDQCVAAGVPFFFKQWGEWAPDCLCGGKRACLSDRMEGGSLRIMFRCGKKRAGRLLDDMEWNQYPDGLTASTQRRKDTEAAEKSQGLGRGGR